jgi:hypothetical protein
MSNNTAPKVLTVSGSLNLNEPYLKMFYQEKPKLILSNSKDDQIIIPHDLLPESQQDGRLMINLVEAVRHLVKTIRELETENTDLKRELKRAMEKY